MVGKGTVEKFGYILNKEINYILLFSIFKNLNIYNMQDLEM